MKTALKAAGSFLLVASIFHAGAMFAVGGLSITVMSAAVGSAIVLIIANAKAEW